MVSFYRAIDDRKGYLRCWAIVLLTLGVFHALPGRADQTIADGVYTGAQASRGEALYATHCADCHLADLSGKEMSPGLKGVAFRFRWADLTLFDLFDRVERTMPQGAPATLPKSAYADIVAYLLAANGYPAADAPLPVDEDALRSIAIGAFSP